MIDRVLDWLRQIFWADSGAESSDDETDFSQYKLYEIGDRLCRHYDSGIGKYSEATHFGDYSMRAVLKQEYGAVEEITPEMVEDLDRLLKDTENTKMQAKASGGIDPNKVEKFRKIFYRQFEPNEINRVLQELIDDAYDDMGLLDCVSTVHTDSTVLSFEVMTDVEQQHAVSESDEIPITEPEFETETIEMKRLRAGIDLESDIVTDTIRDFVYNDAKMLWSEIEPVVGRSGSWVGSISDETVLEAQRKIRESYYMPDVMVVDSNVSVSEVLPVDVMHDDTGVMDVPFVLADSETAVYRTIRQPVTVEEYDDDPLTQQHIIKFNGNYALIDEDAITGPV